MLRENKAYKRSQWYLINQCSVKKATQLCFRGSLISEKYVYNCCFDCTVACYVLFHALALALLDLCVFIYIEQKYIWLCVLYNGNGEFWQPQFVLVCARNVEYFIFKWYLDSMKEKTWGKQRASELQLVQQRVTLQFLADFCIYNLLL